MIRKANLDDIKKMQRLINFYAKKDEMLPRSLSELYENIRDFFVFSEGKKIYGCAALHISWENLAEIKSVAVLKSKSKKGIGAKLLEACLGEAKRMKVKKVFVLTYKPDFFKKFGFRIIDKAKLPHKIWTECIKCVNFPDCDEIALEKEI